jgi:hypothetical protein
MKVTGGQTSVTTYFALRTAADGTATTAATITDIDLQYVRSGALPVAKVDATALAATDSAFAANKAIEIDATDQPGLYRVDWPDAAFAAGVIEVILTVKLANSFTEHLSVEIDSPVNVTKISGDATAADNLELDYDGTGYAKANSTIGTTTTNTDMRGTDSANTATPLTAAQVNAEVDTALDDAISEPSQGAPAATQSIRNVLAHIWLAHRNKVVVNKTSGFLEIYDDAGVKLYKKAIADDGAIYTETEAVTGA